MSDTASTLPRVVGLDGHVAIVTGGGGGIGRATAIALADAGAAVVVVDIHQDVIDALVADLSAPATGPGHLGLALDVRSETDMAHMAASAMERFGRIDTLVACAGILRGTGSTPKPLFDIDVSEWDQVIDTNLKGVFLSNRAVLPTMTEQRGGNIVNISSVSGKQGRAHDGPYCASKFGVVGLTESLAEEVRNQGIRVQILMPDAVSTPFWEQNGPVPMPSNALPPERVAAMILFMLTLPADTMLVSPVIAPFRTRRRLVRKKESQAEE